MTGISLTEDGKRLGRLLGCSISLGSKLFLLKGCYEGLPICDGALSGWGLAAKC